MNFDIVNIKWGVRLTKKVGNLIWVSPLKLVIPV